MTRDELIEELAEEIYLYNAGIYPDEYEKVTGRKQRIWKARYRFQEAMEIVEEHEKDEYRLQAEKVVERMQYLGFIDFQVIKK